MLATSWSMSAPLNGPVSSSVVLGASRHCGIGLNPSPKPSSSCTVNWGVPVTSRDTLRCVSCAAIAATDTYTHHGTIRAVRGLVRFTWLMPPLTSTIRFTPSMCIRLASKLPLPCYRHEREKDALARVDGRRTSIAASVTTAFMVSSWTANNESAIFLLTRDTESAINSSEMGNPRRARSSSSRDAVCIETWNRAGSARARGHHATTNGLDSMFRSRG